jgi:hypothetical protein
LPDGESGIFFEGGLDRKSLICPSGQRSIPVIASEAKQSIEPQKGRMDCFVAALLAMTAEAD